MKKSSYVSLDDFKFSDEQLDKIIDKLAPLLVAPEDLEFFKGVLRIQGQALTTGSYAAFIHKLLEANSK